MDRYFRFDTVSFLRDKPKWDKEIESLKLDLEAITEIQAVDTSKIPTGGMGVSDTTGNAALKRTELQLELERRVAYIYSWKYAFNRLTEEEQDIINTFFYAKGSMTKNARAAAKRHGVNYPNGVYRLRRHALDHFSQLVNSLHQ